MPCEILPSREFYDYEDKYLLDKTRVPACPPMCPPSSVEEIRRLAVAVLQGDRLRRHGARRLPAREGASGEIYINEINTIPGFTSISMYPKMWDHDGLSYSKLLDRLIELALERHAEQRKLKFTR